MRYEACEVCQKDITNDKQFYLCRDCYKKIILKSPDKGGQMNEHDKLEKLIEDHIKELESKVGMKHISVKDNAEQTKNTLTIREMTPQEKNPLTKEEILILVSWFDVLMEKYTNYYKQDVSGIDRAIKLKLESYLEK